MSAISVGRARQGAAVILAALSFAQFFSAGLVLSFVVVPVSRLFLWRRARHRTFVTNLLQRIFPFFLYWMRLAGLIHHARFPAPPSVLAERRACLVVANHPSLIDTIFPLAFVPGLTCVVKAAWYKSPLLGLLVRATHYVPGPGMPGDEQAMAPALDRMVQTLRDGHPLLVFPEGTRSPRGAVGRFRRGAFEAAVRAGVPIVPLRISVHPPVLGKGQPLTDYPAEGAQYAFEWLSPIQPAERESARALMARAQGAFGG